jgi:hypothetical protein
VQPAGGPEAPQPDADGKSLAGDAQGRQAGAEAPQRGTDGGQAEAVLRAHVRAALRNAGLSQAEAARQLDVSTKHLCQMLTGNGATLTLGWAERILGLCGQRLTVGVEPARSHASGGRSFEYLLADPREQFTMPGGPVIFEARPPSGTLSTADFTPASGWCPHCGRGDAAPTGEQLAQAQREADPGSVVHACPRPADDGIMPCCGRTPFEVVLTDRMTLDPALVTCERQAQRDAAELRRRLDLAHHARRGKERQLDGIRRALIDAGAMAEDDPHSYADLEDVIRQAYGRPEADR